jgi:hypothetical protein
MSACLTDVTSATITWDAVHTLLRLLGVSNRSSFHQCLTECMFSLEDGSEIETVPDISEWENLFFLCCYHKEYCFSPMMSSVEIHLWCKALYVWSFNNSMFSWLSKMISAVFDLCTPSWMWHMFLEIGTNSIKWTQLSRFYLKMETESSLQTLCFEK